MNLKWLFFFLKIPASSFYFEILFRRTAGGARELSTATSL